MGYKKFTASYTKLQPDPAYNSLLVSKFVNCLMWAGKKSVAHKVFYQAMDLIAARVKDTPPLEVFETAVNNVKPNLEVRSRRVGGANYQVPMPVTQKRQQALAIRWLIQAIRGKKGRATAQKLAEELVAAHRREGAAMTTRDNVHRMAEANKAFAHFAW